MKSPTWEIQNANRNEIIQAGYGGNTGCLSHVPSAPLELSASLCRVPRAPCLSGQALRHAGPLLTTERLLPFPKSALPLPSGPSSALSCLSSDVTSSVNRSHSLLLRLPSVLYNCCLFACVSLRPQAL